VLAGGKVRVTEADADVVEMEMATGDALSSPPARRAVENIGESDIHAIIFELQQSERAAP
jgi:hypothetical protein